MVQKIREKIIKMLIKMFENNTINLFFIHILKHNLIFVIKYNL